jgi:hypothetical protein
MAYRFDIRGLAVECRVPRLVELTTFKESINEYDACKALVKTTLTSPSFKDLTDKRPGCIKDLGWRIVVASGFDASKVTLLEPDDIDDEEMAAAYVAKSEERSRLYPDPEDDRRRVMPVLVATELGEERRFLLRLPLEREVERFQKQPTIEAAKLFASGVVLWGDVAALEHTLPGFYATLATFALTQAGAGEARRVGEA